MINDDPALLESVHVHATFRRSTPSVCGCETDISGPGCIGSGLREDGLQRR